MNTTTVLLIVPPVIPIEQMKRSDVTTMQWATNCSFPIGLLSIAAYTSKNADVDFKILDLNAEISKHMDKSLIWDNFILDQLSKLDRQHGHDIVGISAIFNSNAGYLQSISATAKKLWPQALVVAGGGLPTNMYSYILKSVPEIDAVAIGEGERPFLGLVLSTRRTEYLGNALGWMTREKISAGLLPTMDLVSNLDDIPPLRYDLVDFEQYQKFNRYHGLKEPDSISASIMTSRGCPYRCNFCASHSVHGRKLRYHSPERVLEDIRRLKKTYGVKIILLEDDNFIVNKRNALKILEEISHEGLTLEFPNGLSIMHLDEEIIDALKAAGMKMATLAVESGSERVLSNIIHKPYTKLSKVRKWSLFYGKTNYIFAPFLLSVFLERQRRRYWRAFVS